ncbi:hypothetical protein OOT46_07635 [Aquabacterium sp. A7-Y]|uniref:hypothetical protein n=1 Tax=Aquabacterium sp. A7-Y TaxID=1349605 RepID=UPI00223E06E8|nr:hypothetical protein [Aquabacterium sp. A7-Y]MCW7537721.1 hypothetical protein [Aquabacterium sp. A7-Y]
MRAMSHRRMNPWAGLLALLLGTAWGQVSESTSPERSVDPGLDNAPVLQQLTPGLALVLQIDGRSVRLADARLLLVPRDKRVSTEGETLRLVARTAGREVGAARLPDARVNVQEGRGLVVLRQRVITGYLPVTTRPDELEVWLPGRGASTRLDLRPALEWSCRGSAASPLCRPGGEVAP